MPEDLYTIFANLLDFNAEEIMSLKMKHHMMKAILCAQNRLPRELLFLPVKTNLSDDPLDRWLPGFPKGNPIQGEDSEESRMRVDPRGLRITHEGIVMKTIMISHEMRSSRLQHYCFEIKGESHVKVAVSIQYPSQAPYVDLEHNMTLLHLSADFDIMSLPNQPTIAASLAVKKGKYQSVSYGYATSENFEVVYDDIVTLRLWDEVSGEPEYQDCQCFQGEVMDKGYFEMIIDIGKFLSLSHFSIH